MVSAHLPPCRIIYMVVFEAPAQDDESSSKERNQLPAGHLSDKKS